MTLSSHLTIALGRSFRGAIKSSTEGPHHVIQLRDIYCEQDECIIKNDDLLKTEIKTNRTIRFLSDGDIIMSAKGSILRAFILKSLPGNTVCTQHFFILKPTETTPLLPEFVTEIINMNVNQQWLHQRSSGSYQKMLTRTTLESMPFPTMSLEQQQDFISLRKAIRDEKKSLFALMENREKQLASLVEGYINDNK